MFPSAPKIPVTYCFGSIHRHCDAPSRRVGSFSVAKLSGLEYILIPAGKNVPETSIVCGGTCVISGDGGRKNAFFDNQSC